MSNPTPISSAAVPAPAAPTPVQSVAAARRAAIRTALSMRLAPLAALVMLIVLVPLGFVANHQLQQTLRAQSDARLQQVAQQYAALSQAILGSQSSNAPDSAVLTTLQRVFAAPGAAVSVELADSSGHALITTRGTSASDASTFAATAKAGGDSVLTIATSRGAERAALASANFGRWLVLAHETVDQADATFYRLRSMLSLVAVLLFAIVVAIGFGVERLVNERIRRPALELANLAEAVAGGNLTVRVNPVESTSEIERLSRSLGTMVTELRRLARGLNEAAAETSAMSTEITASSAQMSSSAAQIAQTASDLSGQSTVMAESIQALAASSVSLTPLAGQLNRGAHEGVSRNARLRTLASENRRMLDDGSAALETLVNDVEATASAVSALVDASEEIRTFVTLVQSLARNSRLLALNAAMEAARAGDQGEGFSVVATEVRRLAAMSSEAAERTQKVVGEVTANVERSREQMERMASAAREVRHATQKGSASFTQIEQSVAELEQWTTSIEAAATGTSALVNQMSERLDAVARGTETFAAAMEQVAAGSEQQSASTQEIAAAAGAMAQSAERLRTLVDNLRVGETRSSGARPAPAPSR